MSKIINYYVAVEGFFEGIWREKGVEIKMTEKQAKYYLLAGSLSKTKPVQEAAKEPETTAQKNIEPAKKAPASKASKEEKGE